MKLQHLFSHICDGSRYPIEKNSPMLDTKQEGVKETIEGNRVYYTITLGDNLKKTTYTDCYKII